MIQEVYMSRVKELAIKRITTVIEVMNGSHVDLNHFEQYWQGQPADEELEDMERWLAEGIAQEYLTSQGY